MLSALRRVESRIKGEWFDPTGDLESDIAGIVRVAIAEAESPVPERVVIVIEGGMVQSVSGTGSMIGRTVHIIDYDTDGADESELSEVIQTDGETAEAIVRTEIIDELTVTLPED
ncbi:hypothetical protein [Mesorhizobium sp. M1B.F.Ca.ET.045.04.1.1]|uniref:hypothetical protein n=1 Tax=Mesorhizobium sp. M1B.F.Ca.ET.045.04.1.1 TaxID=2493673 RepID=UPI000F750B63|nr:hypothetical protein [Mesorhizobium sp. M1B.F.Ca.ET.045.04.1.1]AZO29361.1 hypothetical protein EJ071_19540 [Mesorhizobium sp. M1B.F.Ca.ET.045.04.1.1]